MLKIKNKHIIGETVRILNLKAIKVKTLQSKKKNKRMIKVYFFNFVIHL